MNEDLIKFCAGDNISKIKRILESNPNLDINIKDNYQYAPLHWATMSGNLEVVQLLSARTPVLDINIQNGDGYTALYIASRNGYLEIVRFLLEHGAARTPVLDKNIPDKYNCYPVDKARAYGREEIVKLLEGWTTTKAAI